MNFRRAFLTCCLFAAALFSSELKSYGAEVDPKTQRMYDRKIREAAAAFDADDFATTTTKLNEAESLLPGGLTVVNMRGAVLYKQKKYDEALAAFREVVAKDPNSYPGYFNIAEVLLAQKKYDEALASFEQLLAAKPTDEGCLYRIVIVLALKGDHKEAHRRADKIPHPGLSPVYYHAHAAVEFAAGDAKKGEDWLKQSAVFFPKEDTIALRKVLVEHGLVKS